MMSSNYRIIAKPYFILLGFLLMAQTVWAFDVRVWEYANGDQFKGRFVRELLDKLIIEKEDGMTETVAIEDLSELDQKYTRTMVPPELDAKVSRVSRQGRKRPDPFRNNPMIINDYTLTVELRKKTQRPFTSRLKAEIFMIAEENISGNYVLMDKTEAEFVFPLKKKNAAVELKTPPIRMRIYPGGSDRIGGMGPATRIGQDYAGYLLVVSTMQGDICYTDTSLRPWIEDPDVINNLRDLWIQGRPLWLSRLFDKTGKKIPPPRPPRRG